MVAHKNFFESITEAYKRLGQTIVMYDGKPYYVLAVSDHKNDGIFRIYLDDMNDSRGLACRRGLGIPHEEYGYDDPALGKAMDKWLEDNPDKGVIRKMMNSPLFNKFRPFPLGMCNTSSGDVLYLERVPARPLTQQGLISSMVSQKVVSMDASANHPYGGGGLSISMFGADFTACINGVYPTAKEALEALADPSVQNKGLAFTREFAFIRGPLGLLFLAYRGDIVGILPDKSLSVIKLGDPYKHLKEAVTDLNVFGKIEL